jgi:hypothetical protein
MPGKTGHEPGGIIAAEIIKEQEGIEGLFLPKRKAPFQLNAGALDGWAAGKYGVHTADYCHIYLLLPAAVLYRESAKKYNGPSRLPVAALMMERLTALFR